MKKAFTYFFEDIKNIFKKPASISTLLALAILPGFYAWFNIAASWNPYGNTSNIKVAVANEDSGAEIVGQNINIGKKLVENLEENQNLWWNFTDTENAKKGVYQWKFYASILIPENFSKNLVSFLSENPIKPEIHYIVNEKLNAITPKITGKWVETLSEAIEANFISTIYENFFKKTNLTAEKIEKHHNDVRKAQSLINEISNRLPEIHNILLKSDQSMDRAWEILPKIKNSLPELDSILENVQAETEQIVPIIDYGNSITQFLNMQINLAEFLIQDTIHFFSLGNEKIQQTNENFSPFLEKSYKKMVMVQKIFIKLEKIFIALNQFSPNKIFNTPISKIENIQNKIADYIRINRKAKRALDRGEEISHEILERLMNAGNNVGLALTDFRNFLKNDFPDWVKDVNIFLKNIANDIHINAWKMREIIPELYEKIDKTSHILNAWEKKVTTIIKHWWEIENAINQLQKFSQKLNDDRIDSLLRIMLLDPNDEKNFFKNPIRIKTESLFSSPNYWSAIAPFFTTLSLWTGALLAGSMLSVRSLRAEKEKNTRGGYLWRLLLFLILWVFQAIIVVFGNIFILNVYIVHPWLLLWSCILIVWVFHILVYSLVFLFGKIGNVLSIIILLVQLSAGSGTFPVELTNEFFIKIHPFIPFTYAINALREVSLWIVPEILYFNITILFIMIGIFLSIGLILSPILSPLAIKFNKRTEWMDIFN